MHGYGKFTYYNGDFDPEGLLIAQKLKDKYDDLISSCYDAGDYEACISSNKISNQSLKKLNNIHSDELLEMKELLFEKKQAAYQENNKENIIKYVKNIL